MVPEVQQAIPNEDRHDFRGHFGAKNVLGTKDDQDDNRYVVDKRSLRSRRHPLASVGINS